MMDYEVILTSASKLTVDQLAEFFETIAKEETDPHIYENMVSDRPWSLKSYIENQSRFTDPDGGIVYVSHQKKIVAISCMEKNDSILEQAVLIGVRTWVQKEYRGKFLHSLYLLPLQEKWAMSANSKKVFMTFNQKTRKSLYHHIVNRDHKGSPYETRWDGYKLLGLVDFNNTPQYVVYKDL